ncbi:MAG: Prepilin-type N-terminal cleavage/methylation protein [Verrucomicrobiaceae bacterium]|nr:Prepilin-type N-terminal cleavage/methylation protein [Verrucomicrobiaceae bacterium]
MPKDFATKAADDSSEPPHIPKRRWGCGPLLLVAPILLIAFLLIMPLFNGVSQKSVQLQATNNCRQIIIALKNYAGDHGGNYPVGTTANDAFRELIKAGQFEDETVFTAPFSPYVGDNQIGEAPAYAEALKAGEITGR